MEKKALNGIDLTLNDGDFGDSHRGKRAVSPPCSNMIAGVYPIDSGKIEIDGVGIYPGSPNTSGPNTSAGCSRTL